MRFYALKLVQFIPLTLVSLSSVLLLIITSYHDIVKVLWIHEHEPQASESTTKFDNVAADPASICFLLKQKFGKRISKKHFAFQKETTNSKTRLIRTHQGTCHGVRIMRMAVLSGLSVKTSRKHLVLMLRLWQTQRKRVRNNDCVEKPRK